MAKKRKERPDGVVLYAQSLTTLQLLSDESSGRAIKSAIAYFLNGTEPSNLDGVEFLAYSVMKVDIDNGMAKFKEVCEKNRENRNKRSQDVTSGDQSLPLVTCGDDSQPVVSSGDHNRIELNRIEISRTEQKKTDFNLHEPPTLESVIATAEMKGISEETARNFFEYYTREEWKDAGGISILLNWQHSLNKWASKNKEFIPPTKEMVQSYCEETGRYIDIDKFLNHYESVGWKKGYTQIKYWKPLVVSWAYMNPEYEEREKNRRKKRKGKHIEIIDGVEYSVDDE